MPKRRPKDKKRQKKDSLHREANLVKLKSRIKRRSKTLKSKRNSSSLSSTRLQ